MPGQNGKTHGSGDEVARASFTTEGGAPVVVHFNPESLTLTLGSSLAPRGANGTSGGEPRPAAGHQQANVPAATLSMKLVFDTTHSGEDVRNDTIELRRLMNPARAGGTEARVVEFNWGDVFKFSGTFASLTETLEYFSSGGVPLRASVDLSMTENHVLPQTLGRADASGAVSGTGAIEIGARAGASLSASFGGDTFSARAIAELNGEASVRRLSGASLELDVDIELRGAVAFATGGVSFGAGASLGLELGVGAGFGGAAGSSGGVGLSGLGAPGGSFGGGGNGFDGQPASSAASAGPAQAFAALVATSPSAAAAAGVRGAASGLLAPALAPEGHRSGAPFAGAADARRAAHVAAFTAREPSPTRLEGPAWGARASAGVPATAGAFAGLQARAIPPRVRRRIDPRRLLPLQPESQLRTDAGARFEIGGRALSSRASGLSVDVGLDASLNDRIRFDEE